MNRSGIGLPFATFAYGNAADAQTAIDVARKTFDSGVWSGLTQEERSRIIMDFSDRLTKYIVRIASYESMERGGLINRTGAEVIGNAMTARNLAWYAAHEFKWHEEIGFPVRWPAREEIISAGNLSVCAWASPHGISPSIWPCGRYSMQ